MVMLNRRAVPQKKAIYWWVWALENGRYHIWGPFGSDDEAYRRGFEKFTGEFEVVPLDTKDEAEASRRLRARLLNQTNVDTAFKRFRHEEETG